MKSEQRAFGQVHVYCHVRIDSPQSEPPTTKLHGAGEVIELLS